MPVHIRITAVCFLSYLRNLVIPPNSDTHGRDTLRVHEFLFPKYSTVQICVLSKISVSFYVREASVRASQLWGSCSGSPGRQDEKYVFRSRIHCSEFKIHIRRTPKLSLAEYKRGRGLYTWRLVIVSLPHSQNRRNLFL